MIELSRACTRHRPFLVDFVDHGEVRPGTAAALAHLDRCARCTAAIEATILTITALRRLGETTRDVEPPDDAWPRLRARLQAIGPRRRPAVMSPLAGIAMSFAIVAVLIVPFRLGGGGLLGTAASPTIDASRVSPVDRVEIAYIASVRHIDSATGGYAEGSADAAAFAHVYPDDIRPARKEVGPGATAIRPSEAS